MSEAVARPENDQQFGPPERLHPLYLLTGLGKSIKGAWGLVAAGAVLGAQGRWLLVALGVVAYIVYSLVALLVSWLKLEYRVGANELRIDSGFMSRTSRAIPFDRVTDVDIEQGPLHRLFGLARVRLETGASAAAGSEDGVLDTIALDRAEALREHIRARHGQPFVAVDAEADAIPPMFAMDRRRVATAGLFNFSLAVVAGLFGITQTFGDVLGFDPFKRGFWIGLADRAGPLQELVRAYQWVAVIGGALTLTLLGIATGMIRTWLREHGFRLDRTDTGLRRRRGLLTLTDVTIPAKRVQAAIIASGPVRRAFGWRSLRLQSLASDGAKGDHVVAPLASAGEAEAVLASLGWRAAPDAGRWTRVSRAYVTAFAAILGPAALVALAASPWLGPAMLLVAGGAVTAIAARQLGWRHTRYALGGETLFVEHGWWRHRRAILPTPNIQSIDLIESVWSRAFGICALRLGVAGGGGYSAHGVPALARGEAESLRNALLERNLNRSAAVVA